MLRKIIKIDQSKCNGCGACAAACHEGAITMIDGVAKLTREDYCDGLGDCLPACPTGAITFEMREAPAYDENAVKKASRSLSQWPVQIKLSPVKAPYFNGANLLIAADCTAFAYSSFYNDFINDRVVLIGCPKLDGTDYSEKLSAVITENDIKSVTVARMEVPCCSGIELAAKKALRQSKKFIPHQVITFSTDGRIVCIFVNDVTPKS